MIPAQHHAGDELTFTGSGDETSRPYLRHLSSGRLFEGEATVEGALVRYSFSALALAEAPPGRYGVSVVTETGGRQTRNLGTVQILLPADRPMRESHARKMVRLLEAHLEGRIADDDGRGIESHSIGGVSISKLPVETARRLLEQYRADLAREEDELRRELGLGDRRIIRTQFRR